VVERGSRPSGQTDDGPKINITVKLKVKIRGWMTTAQTTHFTFSIIFVWHFLFITKCSRQRCMRPAGQGISGQEKNELVYCNHVLPVCIVAVAIHACDI
jgi:hypothetical protein